MLSDKSRGTGCFQNSEASLLKVLPGSLCSRKPTRASVCACKLGNSIRRFKTNGKEPPRMCLRLPKPSRGRGIDIPGYISAVNGEPSVNPEFTLDHFYCQITLRKEFHGVGPIPIKTRLPIVLHSGLTCFPTWPCLQHLRNRPGRCASPSSSSHLPCSSFDYCPRSILCRQPCRLT